jgi:hypothetical protein
MNEPASENSTVATPASPRPSNWPVVAAVILSVAIVVGGKWLFMHAWQYGGWPLAAFSMGGVLTALVWPTGIVIDWLRASFR